MGEEDEIVAEAIECINSYKTTEANTKNMNTESIVGSCRISQTKVFLTCGFSVILFSYHSNPSSTLRIC